MYLFFCFQWSDETPINFSGAIANLSIILIIDLEVEDFNKYFLFTKSKLPGLSNFSKNNLLRETYKNFFPKNA